MFATLCTCFLLPLVPSHVGFVSGMRNEQIIKRFNLEYARGYARGKTRMRDNHASLENTIQRCGEIKTMLFRVP
uniref:Putative secreted protein n=1 Tax=Ixodes ricinus TaxID=34613 RepID=A0A6B0U4F9_IXORI